MTKKLIVTMALTQPPTQIGAVGLALIEAAKKAS